MSKTLKFSAGSRQSDEEDISILSTVAYLNLLFIYSSMMYNVEKNEKQQ